MDVCGLIDGARNRNRTGMGCLGPRDFKSLVSTNFTTRATAPIVREMTPQTILTVAAPSNFYARRSLRLLQFAIHRDLCRDQLLNVSIAIAGFAQYFDAVLAYFRRGTKILTIAEGALIR